MADDHLHPQEDHHDHDGGEAEALSNIERMLFDDSEFSEDLGRNNLEGNIGHAETSEQLALVIQEFGALLGNAVEANATAQEEPQPQPEQGSFYGNYAVAPVLSLEEPAASHAQEAVAAAQGMMMPEQQEELGLRRFYGNYVPHPHLAPAVPRSFQDFFTQFQEHSDPHALQPQEAIAAPQDIPVQQQELGLGSYYGIPHSVPRDFSLLPSFQDLIQFQGLAASSQGSQPLQAQEAIAAAQDMPVQPKLLEGLGSYYGIPNSVPNDLPPLLSFRDSIRFQEHGTSHALQAQLAPDAQEQKMLEPGSFYPMGNYVPPDLPPVPSLQHLIQICSKPFEKQLANRHVFKFLQVLRLDAERHVLPLLNSDEDPEQGISVTAYDIAGNEYCMMFKTFEATRAAYFYILTGEGWRNFIEHHGLVKIQDLVTLWAFRNAQTGKLCFVITSRRLPDSYILSSNKRRRQS